MPKARKDIPERSERTKASRRGFFKMGVAGATAATAFPLSTAELDAASESGEDAKTLDRLVRTNADAKRRILLKGGIVVSMNPKVGDLAHADLLIEGKKILGIGPDLSAAARDGKAVVVDATDVIVMPGFCDPHISSSATTRSFSKYRRARIRSTSSSKARCTALGLAPRARKRRDNIPSRSRISLITSAIGRTSGSREHSRATTADWNEAGNFLDSQQLEPLPINEKDSIGSAHGRKLVRQGIRRGEHCR